MNANRCEICGKSKPNSLETHHVVPRRYGGSDQPENLVRLCASCHSAIEKIYDDAFYERLNIQSSKMRDLDEMDYSGEKLNSVESKDKKIPENSPHVFFDDWHPTQNMNVRDWIVEISDDPRKQIRRR